MLTYSFDKFKPDRIIIHGDRKKYGSIMKRIGARWNSRLQQGSTNKDEPGWVISKIYEQKVKELCNQFNPVEKKIPLNYEVRPEDVKESEEQSKEDVRREPVYEDVRQHIKSRKEQKKYHRENSDVSSEGDENVKQTMNFYKKFTKPSKFTSPTHSDEHLYLPNPNTFRKKGVDESKIKDEYISSLETEVNELKYKLYKASRTDRK